MIIWPSLFLMQNYWEESKHFCGDIIYTEAEIMKSVKKQNRICGDNIFVYCAINYAGEMLINKYYDSSEQEEKE